MAPRRAIVILAHGSPDPRWRAPVEELCAKVAARTRLEVRPAYLGHGPGLLAEVMADLAAAGVAQVEVVADFLSAGGKHVGEEIPARIAALRQAHPELELALRFGALGEHPLVLDAMARVIAEGPS